MTNEPKKTITGSAQCCKENMPNPNKLKILAIHGYRQNGEVFRQKTGSFRKLVHKWAQFTYITAPHRVIPVDDLSKVEPNDLTNSPEVEEYGWFFNRDDRTFRGIRKGGPAIGYEETLQFIEDVFEQEGPFDGVMGFSQGACLVGLLCDLQDRHMLNYRFNFAILASGFKSNALPHAKYYSDIINVPALHIYGRTDQIIPRGMSEDLFTSFQEPTIVVHDGGHHLPASGAQKIAYQKFFKQMLSVKEVKEKIRSFNAMGITGNRGRNGRTHPSESADVNGVIDLDDSTEDIEQRKNDVAENAPPVKSEDPKAATTNDSDNVDPEVPKTEPTIADAECTDTNGTAEVTKSEEIVISSEETSSAQEICDPPVNIGVPTEEIVKSDVQMEEIVKSDVQEESEAVSSTVVATNSEGNEMLTEDSVKSN